MRHNKDYATLGVMMDTMLRGGGMACRFSHAEAIKIFIYISPAIRLSREGKE